MARGEPLIWANVRKRGGVWWIRYDRDGRRFEESARTDKWEKARDLLKVREGDIAKGAASRRRSGSSGSTAGPSLVAEYEVKPEQNLSEVPLGERAAGP